MNNSNNKKTLSILVIEDNDMFRKLAVDMLAEYNSFAASNVKDGLAKFKTHSPDIVFLDIGLPDGNGHDLLKQIIGLDANAFVIMLTASNLKIDVQGAIKEGAKGYIIKPFSRKKIKDSIDLYLSEKMARV